MNAHPSNQNKKFLLIRHAESLHNKACHGHENWVLNRFKDEYIDCDLSEDGYEQTIEARMIAKNFNVKTIFVSPLKRTLITCREVFKDHPQKPKVIVLPIIREKLGSACDVPGDINELIKEFPDYDFSLIKEKCQNEIIWLLDSITNEQLGQELTEGVKSKGIERDSSKFSQYILEKMRETDPVHLEQLQLVGERSIIAKKFLLEEAAKLKEGEQIALVSHFCFLNALTSVAMKIHEWYFEDGLRPNNCEVIPYDFK